MELEPDHTIEPYLEARLAMLLELNESWADMEKGTYIFHLTFSSSKTLLILKHLPQLLRSMDAKL